MIVPIIVRIAQHLQEKRGSVNQHVAEPVLASFDHTDGDVWVLCQAGGENEASGTTTTDEVVKLLFAEVLDGDVSRVTLAIDTIDDIVAGVSHLVGQWVE